MISIHFYPLKLYLLTGGMDFFHRHRQDCLRILLFLSMFVLKYVIKKLMPKYKKSPHIASLKFGFWKIYEYKKTSLLA
ncbi:hypothetical protein CXF72_15480 [Psychromonas sp. MB-3u-54]|nr:hypothetical protein CXF72_15480 [Psychromonas sp. MB-3u-54]